MHRIAFPALAALSLLAARPAAAQVQTVEEGTRVRVAPAPGVATSRWVVGTVVASGPDSLTLLRADTRQPFSLHRGAIRELQVSDGIRPTGRTVARHAGVGAVIGAAAGALIGTAAYEHDRGDGWEIFSRGQMAGIGAAYLTVAGAAVGVVVGWRRSGEQWVSVPFRARPAVAVRPDGGVGVALSLKL